MGAVADPDQIVPNAVTDGAHASAVTPAPPGTCLARVAVLLSGRGSNFVALAEACERGEIPARIVLVLSNRPDVPGLDRARERGISAEALPSRGMTRDEHERRLTAAIAAAGAEWICLAGYMRILSARFLEQFPCRVLNIHPALLPAFPGLDAQRQALDHGVKVSGCTVHFVDDGCDSGAIVLQRPVPVRDADTVESLAARILEQEHLAYPTALRMLLTRRWLLCGRRVEFL